MSVCIYTHTYPLETSIMFAWHEQTKEYVMCPSQLTVSSEKPKQPANVLSALYSVF